MMNAGKKFEQNFAKSIPKEVYFMRIKDSANNFSRSESSTFATTNPFDCFVVYKGLFLPIELKSTKGKSFSIQSQNLENGKDIKYHQIKSLERAQSFDNIYAGFVLDFRESNTYWINISDFINFILSTDKKSINEKDVIMSNSILINKKIMRVNYKYDVLDMLDCIVRRYKSGKENCLQQPVHT